MVNLIIFRLFFCAYSLWEPNIYMLQTEAFQLRWYSVLFALGFFLGRSIIHHIYKKEQKFHPSIDLQLIFMVLGTLIGARFGHVIFYQPHLLQADFFELFKFWKGGLSSHGTALGILLAMCFYSFSFKTQGFKLIVKDRLKHGYSYLQVMDRMVIVIALGAVFIRFGNFVNSEIIGKPTGSDHGIIMLNPFSDQLENTLPFVEEVNYQITNRSIMPGYPILDVSIEFKTQKHFERRIRAAVERLLTKTIPVNIGPYNHIINPRGSNMPYKFTRTKDAFKLNHEVVAVVRHPTQLYEALTNFFLFLLLFWIWLQKKGNLRPGLLLGLFMVLLFSFRIFHEFLKENQVAFENEMVLNMGQYLSIPFVFFGLLILFSKNRYTPVNKMGGEK